MCRKKFNWTMFVSSRIQPKHVKVTPKKHIVCRFKTPILISYSQNLNEHWLKLIQFINNSQFDTEKFVGVKGVDTINLTKYKEEGRVMHEDKSVLILKSEEGYNEAVYCCYLPNMSIRLMLSDEEIDFEIDNAAADEAVECLNKQLEACWKILPKLLGSTIYRVFIRKFENVSCSLALCGNNEEHDETLHCEPMKEQIRKLKACNFDSSLLQKRKNKMPSLNMKNLSVDDRIKEVKCCSSKITKLNTFMQLIQ